MTELPPLILTYGMGIGPEVSVKALKRLQNAPVVILAGRRTALLQAQDLLLWGAEQGQRQYWMPFEDSDDDAAEVAAIRWAVSECLAERASALVTGPINKAQLVAKGFSFHGHTEFLGHLCGDVPTVMGFVGGIFKVCLATTHLPLMDVGRHLSVDGLVQSAEIALSALKNDLGIEAARLGVCGLNPHAGENGVLGREEIDVIGPACEMLRAAGYCVVGPISSETAFLEARRGHLDMVMAMYHDQGLTPLKAVDFGDSVNWTLGLPIIRTSVDHGTAEALVGTGQASADSMVAALELAMHLASRRQLSTRGKGQSRGMNFKKNRRSRLKTMSADFSILTVK